jgi:hypothetical protein
MGVEKAWEEWRADQRNQQRKEKLATDPAFYLHHKMRSAISAFLCKRRLSKEDNKSTLEILGYTKAHLAWHIERQFTPEMGWHNRNRWHIDHIVPLAKFKCQSVNDPEFKAAWALSNLRPIWAEENLRKGAKRVFLL